ncbi:MAG: hypothetical protein CK528_11970 [Alcaligenaceae bacterium]|nr:MAG: hypothetical protein CK528_11970 [Alcaligenaceae bacterium]
MGEEIRGRVHRNRGLLAEQIPTIALLNYCEKSKLGSTLCKLLTLFLTNVRAVFLQLEVAYFIKTLVF